MKIRKPVTTLALLAAAGLMGTSAQAVDILYITNTGTAGDIGTLLTTNGHTVTAYDDATYGWNLPDQAAEDYVNGFDLIIYSRTLNFGGIRGQGAKWNALPTPAINLNQYLVSGQFSASSFRWGDASGSAQGNGAAELFNVGDNSDPLFNGITLNPGSPQTVAYTDGGNRNWRLDGASPLPGVTILLEDNDEPGYIAAAYAAQDALRPGGAPQYFFAGPGGDTNDEIWDANGEAMILNAIDALTGGGPPTLPGDTDGDGDVDDADLGVSFANYTGPLAPNTGGKTAADGDVDGDGDVDDADLGASFAAYTGPTAPAAVPEPTSLALLGLGGLLAVRRRR